MTRAPCCLFALALIACGPGARGGVTPGSKDLGPIWFIGDSITQSNADGDANGSPRKSLYDKLTAGGYTFSYTGHFTANTDGLPATGGTAATNLYHYHSGVSGAVIGATRSAAPTSPRTSRPGGPPAGSRPTSPTSS
jgi:hypothetical protein